LKHVSVLQGHLQAIDEQLEKKCFGPTRHLHQLPEDALVEPKNIAIKRDFNDILK
jgi:hypothetical protein